MNNLIVYKASAGSGKTHRLTGEYLKLAFAGDFRHILAVTFTNKATAEMKSRIIDELHRLAAGAASGYLEMLAGQQGADEQTVRRRAGEILRSVLQNYSRFSVGTIDSFFQRIIRGFAREAGLQSAFDLELDNGRVLDRVLDMIIAECAADEELQRWLMDFAESRIREGRSWNFRQELGRLGRQVFSEEFMQLRGEMTGRLSDRSFLGEYMGQLHAVAARYEKKMEESGRKGLDMIRGRGLEVGDFKYGSSGVAGYFEKIAVKKEYAPGKRVAAVTGPEDWFAKNSPKSEAIRALVEGGLQQVLDEALALYRNGHPLWVSARHILSSFYTLGILNDIALRVREDAAATNTMLLTEIVSLLRGIIGSNEAPFIYEKTGWFYRNYMIDEFQDTSRVQWQNFIPLIIESLGKGQRNILVGDVKQSIYRWRNSDWNILASEVGEAAGRHGCRVETLGYNWRSRRMVTGFNNALFGDAPRLMTDQLGRECASAGFGETETAALQEQIRNAYEGHAQKVPDRADREGGYVQVTFADNITGGWREEVLSLLPGLLLDILSRGFEMRDIAILVRNNRDGNEIASMLLEWQASHREGGNRLAFISEEFLLLNESVSVRLLLALIRFIADPSEKLDRAVIINEYCRYLEQAPVGHGNDHLLFGLQDNYLDEGWDRLMPHEFTGGLAELGRLSLYELVEQLIRCFGLDKSEREIPFLMAFQDAVVDYSRREPGGPAAFAQWWEENGARLAVSSNDNQDAVRIMTIHKSKGLQFRVVVVPFADWLTDHNTLFDNFLWCRPSVEPFDELPLVPVRYRSDLAKSIFAADYFREKMQVFVDNLNLLYVALTRAADELYVHAPLPGEKRIDNGEIKSVSDLLYFVLRQWDDTGAVYSCGSKLAVEASAKDRPGETLVAKRYRVHDVVNKPGLRLAGTPRGASVVADDDPAVQGRLIHEIFSDIVVAGDIDRAVMKRCFEGRLSSDRAERLSAGIASLIEESGAASWFDGSWKVMNEVSVLLPGGKTRRPDRVMIKGGEVVVVDYKSGTEEPELHGAQMRSYIRDIESMGYDRVRGFLWYTGTGKIIEVKTGL